MLWNSVSLRYILALILNKLKVTEAGYVVGHSNALHLFHHHSMSISFSGSNSSERNSTRRHLVETLRSEKSATTPLWPRSYFRIVYFSPSPGGNGGRVFSWTRVPGSTTRRENSAATSQKLLESVTWAWWRLISPLAATNIYRTKPYWKNCSSFSKILNLFLSFNFPQSRFRRSLLKMQVWKLRKKWIDEAVILKTLTDGGSALRRPSTKLSSLFAPLLTAPGSELVQEVRWEHLHEVERYGPRNKSKKDFVERVKNIYAKGDGRTCPQVRVMSYKSYVLRGTWLVQNLSWIETWGRVSFFSFERCCIFITG